MQKNVNPSGFWKPFIWVLAAFGNYFVTKVVAIEILKANRNGAWEHTAFQGNWHNKRFQNNSFKISQEL
jgi:hypothetical protein